MHFADISISIEPPVFQEREERADIASAIFHDLDPGLGKIPADFLGEALPARHGRDDQVIGNGQPFEDLGDVGPGILVIDVDDDRGGIGGSGGGRGPLGSILGQPVRSSGWRTTRSSSSATPVLNMFW